MASRISSFETVRQELERKPFVPHPMFKSGHAQTLAAFLWPRRPDNEFTNGGEARLFKVDADSSVLGHCRWQSDRTRHATVILNHGLEGSSESRYMLGTAEKAYKAGFNVIRMNVRTCGGTEHLTPGLYHSGLSDDVAAVIQELIRTEGLSRIYLTGFSMSGNIALKYAGEAPDKLPGELKGICVVSPSVDLHSSEVAINRRSNWVYRARFMHSLKKRMRLKHRLFPERYDIQGLRKVRTLRDFDNRFTSVHGGFRDADDYYDRASSVSVIGRINKPTLIIHAMDDPFIPFSPLNNPAISANQSIILFGTEHGGHVGFLGDNMNGEDRFWAENRIVDFFCLLESVSL